MAYVKEITVSVTVEEVAAAITVDSGGNADVTFRWPTRTEQEAVRMCVANGLVCWATVGPPGGEDSVLVATVALMDQLEPMFAAEISVPGEEE